MIKQQKKQECGQSIFKHYLLSYITVLFIPLFICCIYYMNVISVISEDDRKARVNELQHSVARIDTILDEYSHLGDSLVVNEKVNVFKNVEDAFAYPESYRIIELQKTLPNLIGINQSVFDYFIFFDKSEMVINHRIVYEYRDFYELYLRETDSGSYAEWYDSMKAKEVKYGLYPAENYSYLSTEEKDLLVYVRPLMTVDGMRDNSVVKIYMESSVLDSFMPVLDKGSINLITNQDGDILYCSGRNEAAYEIVRNVLEKDVSTDDENFTIRSGHEKYLAVRCGSGKNDLICYTIQSERTANQRLIAMVATVTSLILMAAAVGMLLSYHMSRRSSMPINDILKAISKEKERYESHQAVFGHLKNTYHELVRTNSRLADAIENQKPFIRNAFVNRLIFGKFVVEQEVEKTAAYMKIDYENCGFCTVIFRFDTGISELEKEGQALVNSCVISLMEVIELVMPGGLYTNIADEQIVLILVEHEREQEAFRKKAEELVLQIKEEMPFNIAEKLFVYGGNLVNRLGDIHESYKNASYMFQNERGQIENTVIWYTDHAGQRPLYPAANMEEKLTHYVTSGDWQGLHDELSEILNTYIIRNNLPSYLQHMLMNELQIIMFRILRQINMEEQEYRRYYKDLEENHMLPLQEQISRTLRIYKAVCEHISRQKQDLNMGSLMPSVVKYIDTNYGNSDLSLTSVADVFGISEPYLSAIFKQSVGINFSSYLEGVRIDKAKELLRMTRMSVSEISEQVGYYSVNSYCRAFKRVTGSSASEYRRSLKNE